MIKNIKALVLSALIIAVFNQSQASAAAKVSFPYTPIGVASWPWWIAKDAGYFEKQGLDVDAIYVGAGGGTPLVTNILQGGDIVQVATMVPYAILSLIVRPEITSTKDLPGKKIGVSRLGAIPHFTLQAITKLYNVQGVNVVQTGTYSPGAGQLIAGFDRRRDYIGAEHLSLDQERLPGIGQSQGFSQTQFRVFNQRPGCQKVVRREESGDRNRND